MVNIKLPSLLIFLAIFNTCFGYSVLYDGHVREYSHGSGRPTPPTDHAKVARTLVHNAMWAAAGTISTLADIEGFPMVNIISIADSGKDEPSTGNIYFLLTMLDFTAKDIKQNNKITFMISGDQDLSCTNSSTDPMEPTCPRVMLTGRVIELENGTEEYDFGNSSFISRHPAAIRWIQAHNFFLCKLEILNIFVLDWYGGPKNIPVDDYYRATPDEPTIQENRISLQEPIVRRTQRELHIQIQKDKYNIIKIEV